MNRIIFIIILSCLSQNVISLECINFQCYNEKSPGCMKCSNVTLEIKNLWDNHLNEMIKMSNASQNYELSIRLMAKKQRGLMCCVALTDLNYPGCSILFSYGSKTGTMHFGMDCTKPDNIFTPASCQSNSETGRCCSDKHCNVPSLKEIKYLNEEAFKAGIFKISKENYANYLYLVIVIPLIIFLFFTILIIKKICFIHKFKSKDSPINTNMEKKIICWRKLLSVFTKRDFKGKDEYNGARKSLMNNRFNKESQPSISTYNDIDISCSGSGAGKPIMTRRSAATDITLKRLVGEGRFGCVWLGQWNGDNVAVKIFSSRDERSWSREKHIYQENYLRHPNVLGFVTTDSRDNGIATELWLVTEYHEYGSLYEYLQVNTINVIGAIKMIRSITNGLAYLHIEINGYECSKPSIAHRDLKSRNILVKSCGECCIGDLGLSLRMNERSSDLDLNIVGTKRYMAPEILNNTIFINQDLDAFKKSDIYSYSLMIWEILRRTECLSQNINGFPYELPYHNCVSNDPSLQEMKQAICDNKLRPPIDPSWDTIPVLKEISTAIQESWYEMPASRLTIMRLKKLLSNLWLDLDSDCYRGITDFGSKSAPLAPVVDYPDLYSPISNTTKLNLRNYKSLINHSNNNQHQIVISNNSKDSLNYQTDQTNSNSITNFVGGDLAPNVVIQSNNMSPNHHNLSSGNNV